MDILNKIIEGMNKEEVRHFKMFLGGNGESKSRMDVRLFNYMRKQSGFYDEDKVFSQLYPDGEKNTFYRLRNRLLSDLNKSLFIQHVEQDDSMYAFYLLSIEKFYFNKNNPHVAFYFLKKAEAQANKTENYEMLDLIYGEYIRLSNDLPKIDPEIYIKLRRENQSNILQLRSIDDVLAVVSHKMKLTQNFSSDEDPVLQLLQKTLTEYSSDKQLSKNPKLRFRIYHAVTQVLLQKRNYETLESYLLNTWKDFNHEKLFNRNNHDTKLQMLVFIINTLFKNGKLKDSLKYTEKLETEIKEYQKLHYDKYLFYYFNSLVINYSRTNRDKAISTLNEMKAIEKIRAVPFYEMFIYLNLAVCYFDKHEYHQFIRHLNRLSTLEGYDSADFALKFKISIAELMIRYELKDFDVLEIKMKQIRKDFKEFFSKKSNIRDTLMVDIIFKLMEKDSLRNEKALLSQARQHILNSTGKDSSDADILNYRIWLNEKISG